MEEDQVASPFSFVGATGGNTGSAAVDGDGWEPVPPPARPPAAEENGRGWEVVAVGAASSAAYDDCSVFPPSLHEGLHLLPDPDLNPTVVLPQHHGEAVGGLGESSSPPPRREENGEGEEMPEMRRWMSDSARRLIGSGLEAIHSKICLWRGGGLDCAIGGGVWSVAALAGFVVALMYLRRRYRREKELLLLLVQEKDQRISHLLHQIALMNEILVQRHRVTILRRL
uniref:Uncharacterized protein LOC105037020 n=1 Tax=Elaeis guineensis var. tenera TaxID=51953 RepID=A0A6I9QK78_ELAGV|nr:uncharacterized protein LOC105037020 [Elaeis guineensis]